MGQISGKYILIALKLNTRNDKFMTIGERIGFFVVILLFRFVQQFDFILFRLLIMSHYLVHLITGGPL